MANAYFDFGRSNLATDFEKLRREMDSLFNTGLARSNIRGTDSTYPRVAIGETKEDVRIYAFAAGLEPQSLDITLQGNILSISASRKDVYEDKQQNESSPKIVKYRKESFSGSFDRVITLPESIDPNAVDAKYENGVLAITINKRPEVKPKKIEIKTL